MTKNKTAGYWRDKEHPEYPVPTEREEPPKNQAVLLEALASAEKRAKETKYRGFSLCRCCKRLNGSSEFSLDGWSWPSGLSHYLSEHNVDIMESYPEFGSYLMRRALLSS